MRTISKILLKCGDKLLFSIKYSPKKPNKDNKIELVSGGIDTDEPPLEGLLRELLEAESTGTLARKASKDAACTGRVLVAGEPHFIFEMAINQSDINRIRMDSKENRGYRIVHPSEMIEGPF